MVIEYILLGVLQGIFEWLPISSEGVVALVSNYLIHDLNAVDVALFLHLGTFLAVMIYFFKDWKEILFFKNKELLKYIFIATLISGAIGFFIYDFAKTVVMGGGILFLMGFGLLLTSYFQKKKAKQIVSKKYSPYLTGILQGFSAIPGISRSGSTIFGLSLSYERPEEILKISYLLSAPVVLGAALLIFLETPEVVFSGGWIALATAFVFGILSLKVLLDFAKKINFSKFTLIFGLICILGGVIEYFV